MLLTSYVLYLSGCVSDDKWDSNLKFECAVQELIKSQIYLGLKMYPSILFFDAYLGPSSGKRTDAQTLVFLTTSFSSSGGPPRRAQPSHSTSPLELLLGLPWVLPLSGHT